MSQPTNRYPSLVAKGVGIDDLQYLVLEDTIFTSPFTLSQPTFDTILDNSSIPLRLAPLAPENLIWIKPNRINEFISYEANMSKEFVD